MSTYFTFEGKTAFKHTVSYVLVSKEQSRRNKRESAHAVQEEEKQPKSGTEKCDLTGDSNKPNKETAWRQPEEKQWKCQKKRKKKKI